MLTPGQVIGTYTIEGHVGDGGMADVYRVRHTGLGSRHALKVLRSHLAASEEIRGRFLAEGRMQAQLRHPNIALVTDLVAEGGVAALVVEWLDGGSLEDRQLANPGTRLDLPTALQVLLPLLDALDELHSKEIVHRDLKPGNILFRDGGWDRPTLADFGVARVTGDALEGVRSHKTRTGIRIGTVRYMSPEQVRGRGGDSRADLYSMSVVAWELLTGTLPFDGEIDFQVMKKIVVGDKPRLVELRPDLPVGVVDAIEKGMNPEAGARFASAKELAEALERAARPAPTLRVVPSMAVSPDSELEIESGPAPQLELEPDEVALGLDPVPAPDLDLDSAPAPAPARDLDLGPVQRRKIGRAYLGGALLLLLLLIAAGGWGWFDSQRSASIAQARQAWQILRTYKTDPDANRDASHLTRALARANAGIEIWPTPEALGAKALALAWQQHWHYRDPTWDNSAWQGVRAATEQAEVAGGSASAEVARLWLTMMVCRRHPDSGERERACHRLPRLGLGGGVERWATVEASWGAALGVRTLAEERLTAGEPPPFNLMRQTLAICERGLNRLDSAPVNGRFLEQTCVRLAGWSGETAVYLRWADGLAQHALAKRPVDTGSALVLGALPQCLLVNLRLDRRGKPQSWDDRGAGSWGDLCVFLATAARGCDQQAFDGRPMRCAPRTWWAPTPECVLLEAPDVPWADAARDVLATAGDRSAACD